MNIEPYYQDALATVYNVDIFDFLDAYDGPAFGAVVTDPPYSSGGAFRGDRMQSTVAKYVQTGVNGYRPDFAGDNRDQRSYLAWCSFWLAAARKASKPHALLASFIDWRQLPTMSDAVQVAGWSWRGVCVWSKIFGRPTPGRFTNACEYVVWGSNGTMPERDVYTPGIFEASPSFSTEKEHTAKKPAAVMNWLLTVVPDGELVFDPFGGSGSTAIAAKARGLRCITLDTDERYCETMAKHLQEELPL